jgi:predicted dehydrogenase
MTLDHNVRVGIIGCGKISSVYFENCAKYPVLDVVACADISLARAQAAAAQYGIAKACTVSELLEDPDIDLVINLTIPAAHAEVSIQALEAGKHVYGEKPLAVTREEGQHILEVAKRRGLRVGSAPDTFLGGGIQTCVKLINEGWIGRPVAATAFMVGQGPEHWHPDPEFYYARGGGPMFDMGPYYLTALIAMLGPIARISGSTGVSFPERTILSEKKQGQVIHVETPTHVAGTLDFQSGVIGTMVMSFDVFGGHQLPCIEIYGSEGTLSVPDPNMFGGPVMLRRFDSPAFQEIPMTHGFTENSRGVGVLDMAYAIKNGRPHRANGELAYHVLEAMHGFHDASTEGKHYRMQSTCEAPKLMPQGNLMNVLD